MKVMTLMRAHNRQGAVHSNGLRAGHKLVGSGENGGLLEYFFGRDGKNLPQHDKFVQFLRDLLDEMVKLEFAHYDYKLRGTISAKDFALSMVYLGGAVLVEDCIKNMIIPVKEINGQESYYMAKTRSRNGAKGSTLDK